MKSMKKLMAFLLVVVLTLALGTTAFAAEPTGKITVTNASAGQEYKLFKLFDATYNTTTQTTAYSTKDTNFADVLAAVKDGDNNAVFVVGTADSDGNIAVSVAEGQTEAALEWIKTNAATYGTQVGNAVTLTSGNTIEWDVPYGYYYITSALGSTLTIDNNTPSVTVIDKNITGPVTPDPDPDDPTNGGAKSVDNADYCIGDTATFTVTFNATNFVTKEDGTTEQITKYIITDTPTNFTLNSDVKVVVGSSTILENGRFDASTGKLELAWVDGQGASLYTSPITVTITYTGMMTSGAAETGEATNKALITYVTDINPDPTPVNPDDPPAIVETYSFTLSKVDGTDPTKKLSGAEFHLYDAATEGNEIALVKDSATVYHVADVSEKTASGFTPAVIVAGEVTIKGLAAGDYYLEETKAPLGYNPLTERVKVTVVSGDDPASVEVENNTGIELPSTGGAGTTMLIVLGSVLFMVTAIVLVTKKRMYNEG